MRWMLVKRVAALLRLFLVCSCKTHTHAHTHTHTLNCMKIPLQDSEFIGNCPMISSDKQLDSELEQTFFFSLMIFFADWFYEEEQRVRREAVEARSLSLTHSLTHSLSHTLSLSLTLSSLCISLSLCRNLYLSIFLSSPSALPLPLFPFLARSTRALCLRMCSRKKRKSGSDIPSFS